AYARTGAVAPRKAVDVEDVSIVVADGDDVVLPAVVDVSYNDGSVEQHRVTWSGAVDWIRGPGDYAIPGVTSAGLDLVATVAVRAENLVGNPSFEAPDAAPWTITGTGASVQDDPDAADGARAVKFWAESDYAFSVTQTIEGVPAGRYRLSATSQGDD